MGAYFKLKVWHLYLHPIAHAPSQNKPPLRQPGFFGTVRVSQTQTKDGSSTHGSCSDPGWAERRHERLLSFHFCSCFPHHSMEISWQTHPGETRQQPLCGTKSRPETGNLVTTRVEKEQRAPFCAGSFTHIHVIWAGRASWLRPC